MSTKNLARTAIEPGRTNELKSDQRQCRRTERRKVRYELATIANDPMSADDVVLSKRVPRPVYPVDQHDKLRPIRKWLLSRVNRPWSAVFAEVSAKFDRRTTPGRHIVEGHILTEIERPWEPLANVANFVIDEAGILRLGPWLTPRPPTPRAERRYISDYMFDRLGKGRRADVERWLAGRLVGFHGTHLYWFAPCYDTIGNTTGHRQHLEFSPEDYRFWKRLSRYWREDVLKNSPLKK